MIFTASERSQHVDLNGDGDTSDDVAHIYDSQTHTLTNLGVAAKNFLASGSSAAIAVFERKSNKQDFNGDGDHTDTVLFTVDLASGALTNTQQATHHKRYVMDENRVVFETSERAQRTDLNGDGDRGDAIVQAWDLQTQTLTNTGLDTRAFLYAGDHIAIAVRENKQGDVDLDNDGDRKDSVLHIFDLNTNSATNLELAIFRPHLRMVISPTALLFAISETKNDLGDLNGDGRVNDDVGRIYNFATQSLVEINLSVAQKHLAIGDTLAAVTVSEVHQGGTDLNGDGDKRDRVIHAVDLASGAVVNTGAQGEYPSVIDRTIVFRSIENSAGKTDLNGDGDRSDRTLRAYDYDAGALETIATVKRHRRIWYTVSAPYVVFASKERPNGRVDLNGDGDIRDTVMQVYDTSLKSLANTGFQSKSYAVGPTLLAIATKERSQGASDQNGDGDTQRDMALNVYDMTSGTNIELPVAVDWKRLAVGDDIVGFGYRERTHFDQVLNGDTDTGDSVLGCAGPLP